MKAIQDTWRARQIIYLRLHCMNCRSQDRDRYGDDLNIFLFISQTIVLK